MQGMEWNGKVNMVLEKLSEGALDLERWKKGGEKVIWVEKKKSKKQNSRCKMWLGAVREGPDWTGVLGEEIGARF